MQQYNKAIQKMITLIYYFPDNSPRERFDDFNNGIGCFRKIKSSERKLEQTKLLQNVFK